MPYLKDIFAVPEKREDGVLADKGRPKPIEPDWGPYAAVPRAMPPYIFEENLPVEGVIGWTYFLSDSTREHCPSQQSTDTHSLHKPEGWTASSHGLEEFVAQSTEHEKDTLLARNWKLVKEVYVASLHKVYDQFGWPDDDEHPELDKEVSRLIARHFGIEFRD